MHATEWFSALQLHFLCMISTLLMEPKVFLVRFALSFYEDPLNYGFGTKLFVFVQTCNLLLSTNCNGANSQFVKDVIHLQSCKRFFLRLWGSLGTPSFICLFVRPSAPKYPKRRFSFLNHPRIMPDPKYDILPKRGQCLLLYGDTDQSGHTILAKSMFHSRGPF